MEKNKKEIKKDTRRKYTREFKLDVVTQHKKGKTLTELSKKYGIAPSTLGTWFNTLSSEVQDLSTEDVVFDTDLLASLNESREEVQELMTLVAKKDREISHLNGILREYDDNNPMDLLEAKTTEIKRLEDEVRRLHEVILMVKEEARREINTLKDAIIIMAKNHEEE